MDRFNFFRKKEKEPSTQKTEVELSTGSLLHDRKVMEARTKLSRHDEGQDEDGNQVGKPKYRLYDSGVDSYFAGSANEPSVGFGELMSENEARSLIEKWHLEGGGVTVLDVCGQGRVGSELGADVSIGVSLGAANRELLLNQELIAGDIFEKKIVDRALSRLAEVKAHETLGLVFFRPVAGLSFYSGSVYAHLWLYEKWLKPVFENLRNGGVMLVDPSITGGPVLEDILKVIPGVQFKKGGNGSYKIKKIDQSALLPSLKELAKNNPDLSLKLREWKRHIREKGKGDIWIEDKK